MRFAFKLYPYRVTTIENVHADDESRLIGLGPLATRHGQAAIRPVALTRSYFHIVQSFLQEMSGLDFTIDICADEFNTKSTRFYASYYTPLSVGINCLAHDIGRSADGSPEVCYTYPPAAILAPVLKHMRECGAKGVMIYEDDARLPCLTDLRANAVVTRLLAPRACSDALIAYSSPTTAKPLTTRSNLCMGYFDFQCLA